MLNEEMRGSVGLLSKNVFMEMCLRGYHQGMTVAAAWMWNDGWILFSSFLICLFTVYKMNVHYFCNQTNLKNGLGFCLLGPDFVLRVDMGDEYVVREFMSKKRKGNKLSKTLSGNN